MGKEFGQNFLALRNLWQDMPEGIVGIKRFARFRMYILESRVECGVKRTLFK